MQQEAQEQHDAAVKQAQEQAAQQQADNLADAAQQFQLATTTYKGTDEILKEVTAKESPYYIIRKFKRVTGLRRLEIELGKERARRTKPDFFHPYPGILKMVKSLRFEGIFGLLMIINGILI